MSTVMMKQVLWTDVIEMEDFSYNHQMYEHMLRDSKGSAFDERSTYFLTDVGWFYAPGNLTQTDARISCSEHHHVLDANFIYSFQKAGCNINQDFQCNIFLSQVEPNALVHNGPL